MTKQCANFRYTYSRNESSVGLALLRTLDSQIIRYFWLRTTLNHDHRCMSSSTTFLKYGVRSFEHLIGDSLYLSNTFTVFMVASIPSMWSRWSDTSSRPQLKSAGILYHGSSSWICWWLYIHEYSNL